LVTYNNARSLNVNAPYVRASGGNWHYAVWYVEAVDSNGTPIPGQSWRYGSEGWVSGDNTWRLIGSYALGSTVVQSTPPTVSIAITSGPTAYALIAVGWWELSATGQWTTLGYQYSIVNQYHKLGYNNGAINQIDTAC
jgi:hypothetical protein